MDGHRQSSHRARGDEHLLHLVDLQIPIEAAEAKPARKRSQSNASPTGVPSTNTCRRSTMRISTSAPSASSMTGGGGGGAAGSTVGTAAGSCGSSGKYSRCQPPGWLQQDEVADAVHRRRDRERDASLLALPLAGRHIVAHCPARGRIVELHPEVRQPPLARGVVDRRAVRRAIITRPRDPRFAGEDAIVRSGQA